MRTFVFSFLLLASSAVSAQTVNLAVSTPRTLLSGAQRTSLGSLIGAVWPSVVIGKALHFHCNRLSGVQCQVRWSSTLDQASLFTLLSSGVTVIPGIAATEREDVAGPTSFTGSNLTSLASFVSSVFPASAGQTVLALDCHRNPSVSNAVECVAQYRRAFTAAQAFTELQAGQTLVPVP